MSNVVIEPEEMLRNGPLDTARAAAVCDAFAKDGTVGAVVTFCGVVRRDATPDGPVEAIEFSAHPQMASERVREIVRRLADDTAEDGSLRVHVEHAVGRVEAGECPILIVVGTGHRKEAFRLCEAILEEIKRDVPIYGKEIVDDGSHRWKVNR